MDKIFNKRDYVFHAFVDQKMNCKSVTYENKVVLFVDILGFKSIIDSTLDESAESRQIMSNLISCFNDVLDNIFDISNRIYTQISHFSDSLVISMEILDKDDINSLFRTYCSMLIKAKFIINSFLEKEILVRGAICQGKIFHKEGYLLFGPAMNEAYILESTRAKYPRIIISKEIIENIIKKLGSLPSDVLEASGINLKRDHDDEFYLDYISEVPRTLLSSFPKDSPSLKEKYNWLSRKLSNA